jgi:hypothetical protein
MYVKLVEHNAWELAHRLLLLMSDSCFAGVGRSDSNIANPFSFRILATYWFLGLSMPLPLQWAKTIRALGFEGNVFLTLRDDTSPKEHIFD